MEGHKQHPALNYPYPCAQTEDIFSSTKKKQIGKRYCFKLFIAQHALFFWPRTFHLKLPTALFAFVLYFSRPASAAHFIFVLCPFLSSRTFTLRKTATTKILLPINSKLTLEGQPNSCVNFPNIYWSSTNNT